MMRRAGVVVAGGLLVVMAACAPKVPPPVVPGAPRYPDFVYPAAPEILGDARLQERHAAAWRSLQAGDVREAARQFTDIVRRTPAFYPAQAGLAYALVAEAKHKDAVTEFDRVLQRAPKYAPALAGRGEAFAAAGQVEPAIASFEAARNADPGLVDLSRRIDVLRFARVNELVAGANRAAAAGRLDEARRAYEQALTASPESAFLYRDLGLVELRAGALDAALGHLRRAVEADPEDVRAWSAIADAAEKSGQLLEAIVAMERVVALDPTDRSRATLDRLRERSELSRLPEQYQAIPSAPQVTRGDLAALIGVRLAPVLPPRKSPAVVVTDVRAHWAAAWILTVTRAGLMDVYANHTFQPRNALKRIDLAGVVSRVLAALQHPSTREPRPVIGDVAGDNQNYAAVAAAVASGVMPLEGGLFRPSRIVSGAEAVDVVGRLESLARRKRPDPSMD
jgi:tetratricopeptide (TPR) repeat protein